MFKNSRKRPYRVAIEGFSGFERASLATFFRLAERRVPAYVQVATPDTADFLIADADQTSVLAWIARERRVHDTVFIGAQAPGDALAWLTRPIEPVHIVRALDALLGRRLDVQLAAPEGDEPLPDREPPPVLEALQAVPEPPVPKARRAQASAPRGGSGRPVLVVDDSRIARAFLAQRLRTLGYKVTLAPTGEEALEIASQTAFSILFLDINLGASPRLDGLQVCQQIKQRAQHPGGVAPAIVITTGRSGATDRVRGSLAGCDAYLTKPLLEAEFSAALLQVDPLFGDAVA